MSEQEDTLVSVTVPATELAKGVFQKIDAGIHFANEPGSMEEFVDFIDRQRYAGLQVTLRTDQTSSYPIADVVAEGDYKLIVYGPHFTTGDEEKRDHGEEATRLAMAARVELDKVAAAEDVAE